MAKNPPTDNKLDEYYIDTSLPGTPISSQPTTPRDKDSHTQRTCQDCRFKVVGSPGSPPENYVRPDSNTTTQEESFSDTEDGGAIVQYQFFNVDIVGYIASYCTIL